MTKAAKFNNLMNKCKEDWVGTVVLIAKTAVGSNPTAPFGTIYKWYTFLLHFLLFQSIPNRKLSDILQLLMNGFELQTADL